MQRIWRLCLVFFAISKTIWRDFSSNKLSKNRDAQEEEVITNGWKIHKLQDRLFAFSTALRIRSLFPSISAILRGIEKDAQRKKEKLLIFSSRTFPLIFKTSPKVDLEYHHFSSFCFCTPSSIEKHKKCHSRKQHHNKTENVSHRKI